ncbi:hypothetical protein ACJIZ3_023114 [Penstemon smallii]|uniref:Uncharacterized protein n=1 Tax=Penstemon smallii TaxID=265156 RepID=A0ABD3TQ57_9LAMI
MNKYYRQTQFCGSDISYLTSSDPCKSLFYIYIYI